METAELDRRGVGLATGSHASVFGEEFSESGEGREVARPCRQSDHRPRRGIKARPGPIGRDRQQTVGEAGSIDPSGEREFQQGEGRCARRLAETIGEFRSLLAEIER